VKRVALALDSDDAGEYAAQRFGERLREISVKSRTVILPAKDASEWIASGAMADDLRSLIAPAQEARVIETTPAAVEFEKLPEGALRAVTGGREYRVRGLQPVGLDRLKVNLRLSVGEPFISTRLTFIRPGRARTSRRRRRSSAAWRNHLSPPICSL
jgi:hypothetical protein